MTRDTKKYFAAVLAPLLIAAGLQMGASPASAVAYGGYTDWRVISAGGSQTCGIRATGQLYCWGTDGTGSTLYPAAGASDWKSVSVGEAHQCAIRSTGLLYCWGSDSNGQIGNGSSGAPRTPARIGSHTSWRWVSAGGSHTCGTLATGALYCWGSDAKGQLGNGASATNDAFYPKRVGASNGWKSVDAGGENTCGLTSRGTLYCWGSDDEGQVGNGSTGDAPVHSPTRITTAAWRSVSAGGLHTCAISGGGTMYCWGDNTSGQIGDGTTTDRPTPRKIGATGVWTTVSTGGTHTCAITTGRTMYCWGNNDVRQSVDSSSTTSFTRPQRLVGTASWRLLHAGARHTCGAPTNGRIYCWGAQRPPSNGLPAGTAYPAQLNALEKLTKWKLTTPVDRNGDGKPDEIKQPHLATYRDLTHFHTTSGNTAAVFRANAGGVTTSGSRYPRSELREMLPYDDSGDADEIWWSNKTGTHIMTMRAAITHLPDKKPHIVVAQIHDPKHEILLIRLDGSRLYTRVRHSEDNEQEVVFSSSYQLGTAFNIKIEARSSRIFVYYNGELKANFARSNSSGSTELDGGLWYFKAGAYCQSSSTRNEGIYAGESPSAFAESVISQLSVAHTS